MNEKKLTDDTEINVGMMDEEIVKDIEHSTGMPSYWKKIVLDLIHRLQSEKAELKAENESYEKTINEARETLHKKSKRIAEQKAEIERLTEEKEEIRLFNLAIQNGEIDMRIESEMAKSFYNSIIQIFEQNGAKNFFTTTIELESQKGKYAFTIEKVGGVTVAERLAELQKQVDELKEKIMNLKTAMISRVAIKSYDSLLTTPDDVEEIFGDAYESEFNEHLGQAVKDTAKEILTKAPTDTDADERFIHWLRGRYGVEVE